MLLISFFIKKLMKKVKNINNCTPILDALLSDWYLIKYSCKCLSVYISIIMTLFLIYNSVILSCHKKSVQLSIGIFSFLLWLDPRKKIFSKQTHKYVSSLMSDVHQTSDGQETKSNKCNQIEWSSSPEKFWTKILAKCCIQV